jgi:alcohol dehydrogenase
MMMASLMAGMAFSNASLGLVHAMAHSLGGAFDLAHGQCNAMLLEKVVRFNSAVASEKYARLALAMNLQPGEFETGKLASALADHVAWIRNQLSIPDRLAELGVNETDLPQLAAKAVNDPCLATNPRQANEEQIKEIYRELVYIHS